MFAERLGLRHNKPGFWPVVRIPCSPSEATDKVHLSLKVKQSFQIRGRNKSFPVPQILLGVKRIVF
jgi:hypothetical protein